MTVLCVIHIQMLGNLREKKPNLKPQLLIYSGYLYLAGMIWNHSNVYFEEPTLSQCVFIENNEKNNRLTFIVQHNIQLKSAVFSEKHLRNIYQVWHGFLFLVLCLFLYIIVLLLKTLVVIVITGFLLFFLFLQNCIMANNNLNCANIWKIHLFFFFKVLLWAAGAATCWLHSQFGHQVLGCEVGWKLQCAYARAGGVVSGKTHRGQTHWCLWCHQLPGRVSLIQSQGEGLILFAVSCLYIF